MSSIFTVTNSKEKIAILLQRMIRLKLALENSEINEDTLKVIAGYNTAQMDTLSNSPDITKLKNILAPESPKSVAIQNPEALHDLLNEFEQEHGDYLPLLPLASENEETLKASLNDFAMFYDVFIKHIDIQVKSLKLQEQCDISITKPAILASWLDWKAERPVRIAYDKKDAKPVGILNQFLAGTLNNPQEWLTDLDIDALMKVYGLTRIGAHEIPFTANNIGMAIHLEREKHEHDDPKEAYVIPLILNLGEDDHSRLDSRGLHWTRMLVHVDPTGEIPVISVNYNDELQIPEASKKRIEQVIRQGLSYREQTGSMSKPGTMKTYAAFPECRTPLITIVGSGEQRDGFTCGHRALQGLIQDLAKANALTVQEEHQELLKAKTSTDYRNAIYKTILGPHLNSNDNQTEVLNTDVVDGLLLALEQCAVKGGKLQTLNPERLQALAKDNKELKIAMDYMNEHIANGEIIHLDIDELLKDFTDNKNLYFQAIFKVIAEKRPANAQIILPENLMWDNALEEALSLLPFSQKINSDNKNLQAFLSILDARNRLLTSLNLAPGEGAWERLFQSLLFDVPLMPQGYHYVMTNGPLDLQYLGEAGIKKLFEFIANNSHLFNKDNFPYQTFNAGSIKLNGNWLATLNTILRPEAAFTPFKQFRFELEDPLGEEWIDNLKELLTILSKKGIESLELQLPSQVSLTAEQADELIALATQQNITTALHLTGLKDGKLKKLGNQIAQNKRHLSAGALSSEAMAELNKNIPLGTIGSAIYADLQAGDLQIEIQQQQQQQVQEQVQTTIDEDELPEQDVLEAERVLSYAGTEKRLDRNAFISEMKNFVEQYHPHLSPEQCWDMLVGKNADHFTYGIHSLTLSAAKKLVAHLEDFQSGLHPDNLPMGFSLREESDLFKLGKPEPGQDQEGKIFIDILSNVNRVTATLFFPDQTQKTHQFTTKYIKDISTPITPKEFDTLCSEMAQSGVIPKAKLVLAYDGINPPVNPNASPLTPRVSYPRLAQIWCGDALQFMTQEQAILLYDTLFGQIEPANKPRLEACLDHFFYLKDLSAPPKLNKNQRLMVLKALVEGMAGKVKADEFETRIRDLFDVTLSDQNIVSMAEILYEQGYQPLSAWMSELEAFKKIKGNNAFTSFKTCFMDPSNNWNELTTEESQAAFKKIIGYTEQQMEWWINLMEVHSSNMAFHHSDIATFKMESGIVHGPKPGERWSNLTDMVNAFSYFCQELEDIHPELRLSHDFPLFDTSDMRVSLDRLLTILRNARPVDEQFYEGLKGLSLDALGPFYASRYEGFKLVTNSMLLSLGELALNDKDPLSEELKTAQIGYTYRISTRGLGPICDQPGKKPLRSYAGFLRYIMTFNHKATLSQYSDAFNSILKEIPNDTFEKKTQSDLVILVAMCGVKQKGQYFSKEEINDFIKLAKNNYNIVDRFRAARYHLNLSLSEILDISNKLKSKEMKRFLKLLKHHHDSAQDLTEALLHLSNNKAPLSLKMVLKGLKVVLHDLEVFLNEPDAKKRDVYFNNIGLFGPIAKIFPICHHTEATQIDAFKHVYNQFYQFRAKYGNDKTLQIIDLLAQIDTENASEPFSLQTLSGITQILTNFETDNVDELVAHLKSILPRGCVLRPSALATNQDAGQVNAYAILRKNMPLIIKEMEPIAPKKIIESLHGADGPWILLENLEKVRHIAPLGRVIVEEKIKTCMNVVYQDNWYSGWDSLELKKSVVIEKLKVDLFSKIKPLSAGKEFEEYSKIILQDIQNIESLFKNMKKIHQQWPGCFLSILNMMNDLNNLDYELSTLVKIMDVFANEFSIKKPFPMRIMQLFFTAPLPKDEFVKALLHFMFDEKEKHPMNLLEMERFCKLALQSNNPSYLEELYKLKNKDPNLFEMKLALLSESKAPVEEALRSFKGLLSTLEGFNQPKLVAEVLSLFKNNPSTLSEFLNDIKNCQNEKQVMILNIVVKAVLAEPLDMTKLSGCISKLDGLSLENLNNLMVIYASPRYPKLSVLDEQLQSFDIKLLEQKFDRDPFETREDKDFDTHRLDGLIDMQVDMNYGRPLLLTQRNQLKRWFLYINIIGKDKGIYLAPPSEDKKAIKDMSHAEIKALLGHLKGIIRSNNHSEKQQLEARLECIALLREAMYRGTGEFPRPNQVLYLLNAMQNHPHFIAQIQTGEGKSLTSAMAAAMLALEGFTADVCTSNLFLAQEGLDKNKPFFDYVGIPCGFISAEKSAKQDYKEEGIHYSSMADMALYRSKMELNGVVFTEQSAIVIDEVDFATQDDSSRYRTAKAIDEVMDPYESPFIWIYESLIRFVDAQDKRLDDKTLLTHAQIWLKNAAQTRRQREHITLLEANPSNYEKRLQTWLIAAGKTAKMLPLEETEFRIMTLEHQSLGKPISKACRLVNGRPNIPAEYSHAVQQFLHLRLRQQYAEQIKNGTMADFLVEPEKMYVSSLNSKLLLNRYNLRWGMTGTVGSAQEIKELYEKYGFKFIEIPPFDPSIRQDLAPILTNPKFIIDKEREEEQHVQLIVKDILRKIKDGKQDPILIQCENKFKGEKIKQALEDALVTKYKRHYSGIQSYYGSEKPTPEGRNEEEKAYIDKAGQNGMITISTVFDRGTDIKPEQNKEKPEHSKGLYVVQTFVDTHPYSDEDLERSKRQKIGRSGRQGQRGETRLIIKRSQFKDVYDPTKLKQLPSTKDAIEQAIQDLNRLRYQSRQLQRLKRESFDDVKDYFYQEFNAYLQAIHQGDYKHKKRTQTLLLQPWSAFLKRIDEQWALLQQDKASFDDLLEFACKEWNELSKEGGELRAVNPLISWPNHVEIQKDSLRDRIKAKNHDLGIPIVKSRELYQEVDPFLTAEEVYCDMQSLDKTEKEATFNTYMDRVISQLKTPAHQKKLKGQHAFSGTMEERIEKIAAALLNLRYQAYLQGNPMAAAHWGKEYHHFMNKVRWTGDKSFLQALSKAQKAHFKQVNTPILSSDLRKIAYLHFFTSETFKAMPDNDLVWKRDMAHFRNAWYDIKKDVLPQLRDYKNKWWTRAWVSQDRKKLAAQLEQDLAQAKYSPEDILAILTTARQTLLDNDKRYGRSVTSSLEGRLNRQLDALRSRVIASAPPEILDKLASQEFGDIRRVLFSFKDRLPKGFLDALERSQVSTEEQYSALTRIFAQIEEMAARPSEYKNRDLQCLYRYCQQKQIHLMYYFNQCDALKNLNQSNHSTAMYKAATAAMVHLMETPSSLNQAFKETVDAGICEDFSQHAWYQKLQKNYEFLVVELEQAIIENHASNPRIEFKSVHFGQSDHFKDHGFKLSVSFLIDQELKEFNYHFNLTEKTFFCDGMSNAEPLNEGYGNGAGPSLFKPGDQTTVSPEPENVIKLKPVL